MSTRKSFWASVALGLAGIAMLPEEPWYRFWGPLVAIWCAGVLFRESQL